MMASESSNRQLESMRWRRYLTGIAACCLLFVACLSTEAPQNQGTTTSNSNLRRYSIPQLLRRDAESTTTPTTTEPHENIPTTDSRHLSSSEGGARNFSRAQKYEPPKGQGNNNNNGNSTFGYYYNDTARDDEEAWAGWNGDGGGGNGGGGGGNGGNGGGNGYGNYPGQEKAPNNLVNVSISVAFPNEWDLLSFPQINDALLKLVSLAANELFHLSLDHSIHLIPEEGPVVVPQDSNNNDGAKMEPSAIARSPIVQDWLDTMSQFSNERLYQTALDYFDLEDDDDIVDEDATANNTMLKDLKSDIRKSIRSFLFEGEGNGHGGYGDGPRDGTGNQYGQQQQGEEQEEGQGQGQGQGQGRSSSTGIWQMFLSYTHVDLVWEAEDYSWWEVTMTYPVFIDANHTSSSTTATTNDGRVSTQQQQQQQDQGNDDSSSSISPQPHWVPVLDQGTLDFISRLLQRVLKAAIITGEFEMALQDIASLFATQDQDGGDLVYEIVQWILALAMPGEEYWLMMNNNNNDSPEDGDGGESAGIAMVPEQAADGMAETSGMTTAGGEEGLRDTSKPSQPPTTHGIIHDHSILDKTHDHSTFKDKDRQRVGMWMLIATCLFAGTMTTLAILRTELERRLKEQSEFDDVWRLATQDDVDQLLQIGWRHYKTNSKDVIVRGNGGKDIDYDPRQVEPAEILEVFDKGQAGYRDDDSMLHGSTMIHQEIVNERQPIAKPMDTHDSTEPSSRSGNMTSSMDPQLNGSKNVASVS